MLHTTWPQQPLLMAVVISPPPHDLGMIVSWPTMGFYPLLFWPSLFWKVSSYKEQRMSGLKLFHNNFTLSLHCADRVPRPAPLRRLQHFVTIHNVVVQSYYAFQDP